MHNLGQEVTRSFAKAAFAAFMYVLLWPLSRMCTFISCQQLLHLPISWSANKSPVVVQIKTCLRLAIAPPPGSAVCLQSSRAHGARKPAAGESISVPPPPDVLDPARQTVPEVHFNGNTAHTSARGNHFRSAPLSLSCSCSTGSWHMLGALQVTPKLDFYSGEVHADLRQFLPAAPGSALLDEFVGLCTLPASQQVCNHGDYASAKTMPHVDSVSADALMHCLNIHSWRRYAMEHLADL